MGYKGHLIMKKLVHFLLSEWKFFIFIFAFLYGVFQISASLEKIERELRDIEFELKDISSISFELSDIANNKLRNIEYAISNIGYK